MESYIYEQMLHQDDHHWWFISRRAIVASLIRSLPLPAQPAILDAGCGSGGNLQMLSGFGDMHGFEMHDANRQYAIKRNTGKIEYGKLPDAIPFPETQFDLITLLDVLEHIQDDGAALRALRDKLAPGGYLLVTVPAFQLLFSNHDKAHHHFRRYGKKQLRDTLEKAGFTLQFTNYWNFWLFLPTAVIRLYERIKPGADNSFGLGIPPAFINNVLTCLVSGERHFIQRLTFPFGLSLVTIAQKANDR